MVCSFKTKCFFVYKLIITIILEITLVLWYNGIRKTAEEYRKDIEK